jgi:hypothetical protein
MTLRQPDEDAVLPAGDIVRIRQALAACSAVLGWAGQHGSLQLQTIVAQAAEASGLGRGPGILAYQVSLAIDSLDFAPAAGSTR